ncbi:LOW QUALITY PROTEIN: chondroitin sulfate proteoglycan 4 [Harpia harpyja]|uniref:LOW QUALITY PROTEIN: chondroitin sulfate proteoglycan 4 n=1 Tax=Harpia harpyja TaxID=202280 RepID=UPI0022B09BDE|nr:LOW QUALITY PROTEIN: chondroitin sulfate proteoglycan 4 [Harpia harpyja]
MGLGGSRFTAPTQTGLAGGVLLCLTLSLFSPASFFGDGYVEMPLADASRTVRLRLQLYTSQGSGLLFLAAGQPDHLLLQLRAGSLQARLRLGSEEVTLQSPAELQLNNLAVHDVELLVEDGRMTLTIDGLFNSSVDIVGPVRELDIQYGLYAGGTGSLDLPYLAEASSPFRGCLHLVTFNGLDVLSPLSSEGSSKIFHRVQEGCSTQFSAEPEDPFGFLGPHSYIAFPTWDAREEATIEFVITTSITQAPLIYHAGLENDFFYLEISNGRLRGFVEKGNGIIVLHNNVFISDEQQHYVKVYTDIHKFEILIDYYASSTSNRGINNYLDLQGNLFIGGMNEKALQRLREHHLAFISVWTMTNNSFVGCLEDLRINLQRRSLQDTVITKDITSGCGKQEHYWDYDEVYEQDEAPTSPPPDVWLGAPGLVVEPCRPDSSFPPAFANVSRLLHVSPLIVSEGATAYLEWKHAQPTVDLSLANIRQSQVLFSITNDPRHGQLELDIPGSRSRRKFTLLDIVNRKVRYVHDGSEGPMDQLMLEVTVTAQQGVPECLRQGQMYLLPIMINPINDAPQVIFPQGNHMTILKHTRKHLTTDILQVLDDDTSCDDLEFQLHGGQQMEEGYVEYDFHPGVPIEEFSCRDLEAGNVAYVHQSGTNLQLTLQVSDGTVPSPVAILRILAIDPDIHLHNNTGLSISQGGAARITTANLSVTTNAEKQRVAILYVLTEPLRYGEVQKQGSMGGEWKKVESFHQQDLEQGRIQYFSTDPEHRLGDVVEKLRFEVQVGQKILQNNTFLIRIKRATVKMRTMVPLQMKNKRHRNITSKELEAMLEDPNSAPVPFHYTIIQAPKKGNLELLGNRLTEGFGFTQDDLQRNHVSYSATIRNSQQAEDTFQFRVHAGEQHSPIYTYTISIGGDPDAPALTNILLTVPEGGQAVISKDHLFVQSMNSMDYLYEVIEGPAHGRLAWAASHGWASREEITEFTNDDILHQRLLYQHDDSETLEDDIPFVAIRQGEGSAEPEAEEVRGVFRVSIQPVNDHTPVQVVNKVFNVVRNGQHLLTTDDIAFTDKDSGFSDTQLVLARKDILFGSIVSVDDRSHQVYRFTQDDLRKKKILFVHSGADRGWIQLQISDGLHQTTALLEVQASDPYIKIVNNTGLVIHQGSRGSIDSSVLSLETNMDIRSDEEIRFLITTPPRWGDVLRGEQPVMAFSQRDLLAGEISYHHNGSRNTRDELQFTVEANEVVVEDTLAISVFLDTHPSPLRIVNHKEIHVFQGEAAGIKEEYLLVAHEEIPPQDIVYLVSSPPASGFLAMLQHGRDSNEQPSLDPIQSFTQEDINNGRVLYLHSKLEEEHDRFVVDITASGADPLEGVVVSLAVLPITIPLDVRNITVPGGSSATLSTGILNIPNAYYTALGVEFRVLKPPQFGTLLNSERPEDGGLHSFTWSEVEKQQIHYRQDGPRAQADSFTLLANTSEMDRQSQPRTLFITILPRSSKGPRLRVNAGLQLREGATAAIGPHVLSAEDEDSPAEEVTYSIQPPANGKVVLRSAPGAEVRRFTQAQINNGLVLFVHQGPLDGGFAFELWDGENLSPGHFFLIRAQKEPLISLAKKQNLTVCPGALQPITSQNLQAVSNSPAGSATLYYSIEQAPHLGRLSTSRGEEIRNFTQAQVDSGLVFYQHKMPEKPFWLAEDAIRFRVVAPTTISDSFTLLVLISFEARCPQHSTQLWRNAGLQLARAQRAEIGTSVLDASNLLSQIPVSERAAHDVVFLVTGLPAHGQLLLAGVPLEQSQPFFLQSDLATGHLVYAHGGDGTSEDRFRFKAWLRPRVQQSIHPPQEGVVISEAFNITVTSSSRKPPQVVRRQKVLQVPPGSMVTLSQEYLDVADPSGSPEEMVYSVLQRPLAGHVAKAHNPREPINHFTQADVNAGHVVFVATGSRAPGSLALSLSDGHHPPTSTSLEVEVLPATSTAASPVLLEVPQDLNRASVSHHHLLGAAQLGAGNALYRITRDPRFGQVQVNQKPAQGFSQKQLDRGEVMFTFTDLTSPEDNFQFLAMSQAANTTGVVNVTVRALVKAQMGSVWPRGTTVLLDTSVLDASELANRTKSIPVFKIRRAPRGSRLVRVSGDPAQPTTPIETFSQSELEQGLVGLEVPDAAETEQPLQSDSFVFELAATGVPPALASLGYSIEPYNASKAYGVTLLTAPPGPSPLVPRSQGTARSSPNASELGMSPTTWPGPSATTSPSPVEGGSFLSFVEANMFSIIIPICLIFLLLALILPLLFYLHKRNKTGKHHVQGTPSSKAKNGAVPDQETFRRTDPNQGIPLTTVNTLEGKGSGPPPHGTGPGAPPDPELLQYCRTSNPPLKNNQYWV